MSRKPIVLAMLIAVLAASVAQADLVALKRGPEMTVDTGLDQRFKDAIAAGTLTVVSGPDAAADADLYYSAGWATQQNYMNYGGRETVQYGNVPILSKFKLSALPNFLGGRVNKAQLRFYYSAGNTGLAKTGYVISSDWIEGTKSGTYPGAEGGISGAHPMGYNTGQNQDANGGTTGPLATWANNDFFNLAKDVSAEFVTVSRHGYSAGGDTYGGFAVYDVTSFVQSFANGTAPNYGFCTYDTGLNYTVHYSETSKGAQYQPVLVIDYEPNAAPNGITDLAVTGTDWFKVNLQWTAPSDSPPGPVSRYEVRYSTSPIDDSNWENATLCTCWVPTPATPGTTETLTIKDLAPNTTYYFAIKCYDITNLTSPISNVVSTTTLPVDSVAPAQISLAATNVKPNYVVLEWTAVGDDGVVGVAADYDLRYSTNPINAGNFEAATRVNGMAAPNAAGSVESFTIRGLMPNTTYYFAIKAGDEVPNWSAISNVVVVTTLEADLYAPNAVGDLKVTASHIRTVYLSWTAPADVGTAGLARYDVRYSTSPIDAGNFDAATQATDVPVPSAPGTIERMSISGLTPETTYYFAVKSIDHAEPANVSAISNIASGATLPPVLPITIQNPWIVNDRVADTHNIATMGATYQNAYTPDGVFPPTSEEEKAINVYNNQKRRLFHWADEPPSGLGCSIDDPTYVQNVFGWVLCGRHASQACTIINAVGLTPRKIGIPGHWVYEVKYSDGTWHFFDTMTTCYVYDRANPRRVASLGAIQQDNTLITKAVAEGRACPGFLLCGDTPEFFCNGYSPGEDGSGVTPAKWTGNMVLRIGETFARTWESWPNQHPTANTNANSLPGNDPPYHHECNKDWQDTVNLPYWEPYQLSGAENTALGIDRSPSYRRWSNGTYVLAPDFTSQAYQAMLEPTSSGLATYNDDGLTPNLHVAAVGTTANAIFKIGLPYYLTDATISGSFYRKTVDDVCKVYVSANGTSWTQVWSHGETGTSEVTNLSLRSHVFGKWEYYVKIELKAVGAVNDVGVDNLVINTIFEHNKGAMAYLDKGTNNITVTFDNPEDLASGRAAFKVTYTWKEFDGTGWNIPRTHEQYVTSSPTTFTIEVGGTKVPRTESITMEVTEPPTPDSFAPDAVTDLAVVQTESVKVTLGWTATGDDGVLGQATTYDLRYSTSPITDDASFLAATQAVGVPAPKPANSAETFVVNGLAPSTTYYFAIKVKDEGGNISPLSNVVVATTLPPDVTAPAFVTDLLAKSSKTAGAVNLTWTAVGNNGFEGTAASYDLRYSTSPIDESNFDAATPVAGLGAPRAPMSAESFTVTGLAGGTRYYFAIKVADEAPNTSEISNIASALAPVVGEKTLQAGVDGYIGCFDTYVFVGSPTTNYGGIERMTVTGYGPGNYQRGYIQFDLSTLPAGATLTKATLSMYAYDPAQSKGSSGAYGIYPITRSWNDKQATWNNAASNTPWTTPGGDFSPTPDAQLPKQPPASVPCWYNFDVTARVQQWLAAPATNFGWCLKVVDEAQSVQDRFYQSDGGNANDRPKLVVTDLVPPVPGDISGDAAVDVEDLLYFVESFGYAFGERGYDVRCDFNNDGIVDVVDLLTFVQDYWPQ